MNRRFVTLALSLALPLLGCLYGCSGAAFPPEGGSPIRATPVAPAVDATQPEPRLQALTQSASNPPPVGEGGALVVARFELQASSRDEFVLHGTLPVPPGAVPAASSGSSPFHVRSRGPGRPLIPAQVEVVSRAPTGEPDVVEILARVALAAGDRPGNRVTFDVVQLTCPNAAAPARTEAVTGLFAADQRCLLRTTDVFGNVYETDLLGAPTHPGFGAERVLATGVAAARRRVSSVLVPVSGDNADGAPLPHLMGVHAYWTERAGDDRVSLDLRIHNGLGGGTRTATALEGPVGVVYWRSLELVLPPGWSATALAPDPFTGTPRTEDERVVLPLVSPNADGKLHMMGPQGQMQRRLVLAPSGDASGDASASLEGMAFCVPGDGLWSWYAPATAHYFPQGSLLARFDRFRTRAGKGGPALEAWLKGERDRLRSVVATGVKGRWVKSPAMGWAQPWFDSYEGSTGGFGIQFLEGHRTAAASSSAGYERLLLIHRLNAARQPEAAWTARGEPLGRDAWTDAEGRVAVEYYSTKRHVPQPFKLPAYGGPPASAHVMEVVERGLRPSYDGGNWHEPGGQVPYSDEHLLHWLPHDGQHLARWTKIPEALVWLGNDPLAKDDLWMTAELFLLMTHEKALLGDAWRGKLTLTEMEAEAAARPGQGMSLGRMQAWGIDAACAYYSVADDAWRNRNRPWFERMGAVLVRASMQNGLVQRKDVFEIMGHDRYEAAQTYQSFFLRHAMRCMNESVLRGVNDPLADQLDDLILRGLEYLCFGPLWQRMPDGASGPRWAFAVAPKDGQPPYCDEDRWGPGYLPPDGTHGGIEVTYLYDMLVAAERIAPAASGVGLENRYLLRALESGPGYASFSAILDRLFAEASRDPSTDYSCNWAGFAGRLQSLGL